MRIRVEAIPALESNYIWLVHDGQHAVLVDPGCASAALARLHAHQLHLVGILITHHHHDHIGGVAEILAQHPVPVWGPNDERIDGLTHAVSEGDRIEIPGLDLNLAVLETPGHTRSHVIYYNPSMIFAGDTLFSMGCGRLFEGTPAEMLTSVNKVAKLNPEAELYCGHEYTEANGRFAQMVDPQNNALQERLTAVRELRAAGQPTLPVTLATELDTNPFLRTRDPSIVMAARAHDPDTTNTATDVFATLRAWKDQQP